MEFLVSEFQNLFCYSLRERETGDCFSVISFNNIRLLFLSADSIRMLLIIKFNNWPGRHFFL